MSQGASLKSQIIAGKVRYPTYFDMLAKELLKNLLVGDLTKRYGNLRAGSSDIFAHGWFAEVDWDKLYRREIPAPYVPKIDGEGDASQYVPLYKPPLTTDLTAMPRQMSVSTARRELDHTTTFSQISSFVNRGSHASIVITRACVLALRTSPKAASIFGHHRARPTAWNGTIYWPANCRAFWSGQVASHS